MSKWLRKIVCFIEGHDWGWPENATGSPLSTLSCKRCGKNWCFQEGDNNDG